MKELNEEIARLLVGTGWVEEHIEWTTRVIVLLGIILVCYMATLLFNRLVIPALQKISKRTKTTWDDHLFNTRILSSANRLVPPLIVYILLPAAFYDMPVLLEILQKVCLIYLIVMTLVLVHRFTRTLGDISDEHEALKDRPLRGVYQMINLLAAAVGVILIISILIDRNATSILAGLGASAAILMLIFRDSILGLVAGVQLSANDMLRPGDWITMTKYGANGYVTEVTLSTVKVLNFDKTITTIPPYALVSDSFQNWRSMRECGGRRITRSVFIDANTVRPCTEEEVTRFREEEFWEEEEGLYEAPANLYAFRCYMLHYMRRHPIVHPDLMQMVRVMQPTPEGVPVELYCFSRHTEWVTYESLQSALTDHVLMSLPRFGLRVFQRPAGTDIQSTAR